MVLAYIDEELINDDPFVEPKIKKNSRRKKSSKKFDRRKQKRRSSSQKRKQNEEDIVKRPILNRREKKGYLSPKRRSDLDEATEEVLQQYRSRPVRPSFRKNQSEHGQSMRPLFSNGRDVAPTYRIHKDRNGQRRQSMPNRQNLSSQEINLRNSMPIMHEELAKFERNVKRDDMLDYGYFCQDDDSEETMSNNSTDDGIEDTEFEAFCAQGHRLTPKFLSRFQCTLCERHYKKISSYQCTKCKYDVCPKCYDSEEPIKPDDFQEKMKERKARNSRRGSASIEVPRKHRRGSTSKKRNSQSRRNSSTSTRSNVSKSNRGNSGIDKGRRKSRERRSMENGRRGSRSQRSSLSPQRRTSLSSNHIRHGHGAGNYISDQNERHFWERFDRDEEIEEEFEKPQLRNLDKDEYSIFGGIWIVTIPPINTNGEEVVVMQDGMVFSKGYDTGMRFDVHMCRLFSTIHNDVWQLVHIDDSGNNLGFHFNGESMTFHRRDRRSEELDAEQRNFYLTRPKRKRGKIQGMGIFSCMGRSSSSTKSSKTGCFSF